MTHEYLTNLENYDRIKDNYIPSHDNNIRVTPLGKHFLLFHLLMICLVLVLWKKNS